MSVGLIAALPAEARFATGRKIPSGTPVSVNEHLVVCVSGMGPEKASRAARQLIEHGVGGLVSWGTSAALVEELKAGDLVLPGRIHGHSGRDYATDARWRDAIRQCVHETVSGCHVGGLAETPCILRTVAEKTGLHQRTGAICADMETAAILTAAGKAGLPAIAVRAIIDERHVVLPEPLTRHMNDYGEPDLQRLVMSIFLNPVLVPRIMRLAGAMQKAGRTLDTVRRMANRSLQFNQ
ncbi:MAG TPA: hypothetical protein VLN56_09670 [Gammaproteobacteria bacterium]|nr:hypothetical protein [Gammaproteobacteria bacterium]